MKTFTQKKPGTTIDNFYETLLHKTMHSSGLSAEQLSHNPNAYMHYEDHSKYVINNLDSGVALFENAVKHKYKIYAYADYDVDGIVAAANLKLLCSSLGLAATIYIPDRYKDGYGLTSKFVDRIIQECNRDESKAILLTFDNGIAAINEIAKAKAAGIQVAVFDHHQPKRDENGNIVLPNADVVCDPHVTGGTCVDYCGAGLAYKFAQKCYKDTRLPQEQIEYMLNMMCVQTAIATIADSVPFTLENYQIVEKGLTLLSQGKCTYGMKLLAEDAVKNMHAGLGLLGKNISTADISFGLVPVLNAWGRLEGAGSRYVAQLLSYNGGYTDKMSDLRNTIFTKNDLRKQLVEEAMQRAEQSIPAEVKEKNSFLVFYDSQCMVGLCGLVAGNLAEKYHMPCICLTDDPADSDRIKGSGRSYGDINIKDLLDRLQNHLAHYGGHPAACGLTLNKSNLTLFTELCNKLTERCEVSNTIEYDLQCTVNDALSAYNAQAKFMWSIDNPCPVTIIEDMRFDDSRVMGKTDNTIKVTQYNPITHNSDIDILHFNGAALHNAMTSRKLIPDPYKPGQIKSVVDKHPESIVAVGILADNVWNNRHSIQLLANHFADAKYITRDEQGSIISCLDPEDLLDHVQQKHKNQDNDKDLSDPSIEDFMDR